MEVLLGPSFAAQPNPPIAPLGCPNFVRNTLERYVTSTIGRTGPAVFRPFVSIFSPRVIAIGRCQISPCEQYSAGASNTITLTVCAIH